MPGPGSFSPPRVAPAPGTGKGKTVAFTAPTYFENSGNEWSDDGEGESGDEEMSGEEEDDEEVDWNGEGEFGEEGEEGFEDEEESEEEEDDEDEQEGIYSHSDTTYLLHRPDTDVGPEAGKSTVDAHRQLEEQLAQEQAQQLQLRQQQQSQANHDPSTDEAAKASNASGWNRLRLVAKASADSLRGSGSSKDDGRSQLGKGLSPAQRSQLEAGDSRDITPQQQLARQNNTISLMTKGSSNSAIIVTPAQSGSTTSQPKQSPQKKPIKSFDAIIPDNESLSRSNSLVHGETKKLTLTPDIARDSQDSTSADPVSGSSQAAVRSYRIICLTIFFHTGSITNQTLTNEYIFVCD